MTLSLLTGVVMAAIGTGITGINAASGMMMISLPTTIAWHAEVEVAMTLKMSLTPLAMAAIGMKLIQLTDAMVPTIGMVSLPI
jgi:hypothetical protein